MRRELGGDFLVIEEGLNGRTTVWDDPLVPGRNGKEYLVPCLNSHRPLDFVVLFLGTNDLKKRFSASAQDIAQGVGVLAGIVAEQRCGASRRNPGHSHPRPAPAGQADGLRGDLRKRRGHIREIGHADSRNRIGAELRVPRHQ